jgi:hypothetical protein
MVADGMLTRKRYREVPPRVDYELTERSRELAPVLGELARWGFGWAWGPPRANERVDISAIFRLIPGLLADRTSATGTIMLTVSDGRSGGPLVYRVSVSDSGATVSEGDGLHDAQLSGTTDAWVKALCPLGDPGALSGTGDPALRSAVLEGLTAGQARQLLDAESLSA